MRRRWRRVGRFRAPTDLVADAIAVSRRDAHTKPDADSRTGPNAVTHAHADANPEPKPDARSHASAFRRDIGDRAQS